MRTIDLAKLIGQRARLAGLRSHLRPDGVSVRLTRGHPGAYRLFWPYGHPSFLLQHTVRLRPPLPLRRYDLQYTERRLDVAVDIDWIVGKAKQDSEKHSAGDPAARSALQWESRQLTAMLALLTDRAMVRGLRCRHDGYRLRIDLGRVHGLRYRLTWDYLDGVDGEAYIESVDRWRRRTLVDCLHLPYMDEFNVAADDVAADSFLVQACEAAENDPMRAAAASAS